jgi:aflatoxin B1 aldehyde reductase
MQNAALGNKYDHSKEGVRECMQHSLDALQTNEVDLYYLHAPDREVPFEETLQAVNEEYKQGHFKRFGISNYKASEVEEIMEIVKKNNYVAPTVYQGLYNAITRTAEEELLPVLRKHKISYYTYNPLGGGFFTGAYSAKMKEAGGSSSLEKGSRFDENTWQGQMYRKRYFHDAYFTALETIQAAAEKSQLSMAEIALRWNMHHSALKKEYNDHVIVSASSVKHIEDNLVDFEKGPLPDDVVAAVDEAWSKVRDSPNLPKYHF